MPDYTPVEIGFRYRVGQPTKRMTVRVIEATQGGPHRGKWTCMNEGTGRRVHKTTRQLQNGERLPNEA